MPGFMLGAVIFAVRVACDRLGLDLPAWLAEPAGEDGGSLTALFERVPRDFDFRLEAPLDLAEKVADVWHHPDCPEEIREALNVGTSDSFNLPNGEEGWRRVYQTAPAFARCSPNTPPAKRRGQEVKRRVELGFS